MSFKLLRVQLWCLYSVAGIEYYRVMTREFFIHDFVLSLLIGLPVPVDCNDDNPVVLIDDQQSSSGDVKMVSMRAFDWHYSKYKKFNSMREYRKYMNSTD